MRNHKSYQRRKSGKYYRKGLKGWCLSWACCGWFKEGNNELSEVYLGTRFDKQLLFSKCRKQNKTGYFHMLPSLINKQPTWISF